MELKPFFKTNLNHHFNYFNRTNMELKPIITSAVAAAIAHFNRTNMELKLLLSPFYILPFLLF